MTQPLDLDALRRLLAVISPLPYWIEAERKSVRHGYNRTLDAYIACGTQGDPTDTYDVIERYEVDTDYAYLVAAANSVPELLDTLAATTARAEAAESDLAAAVEREQRGLDLLARLAIGIAAQSDGFGYPAKHDRGVVQELYERVDPYLERIRNEMVAARTGGQAE